MTGSDYSIEEAAVLMETAQDIVHLWVSKKLIGSYKLGKGWRISADEVAAVVNARREREREQYGSYAGRAA